MNKVFVAYLLSVSSVWCMNNGEDAFNKNSQLFKMSEFQSFPEQEKNQRVFISPDNKVQLVVSEIPQKRMGSDIHPYYFNVKLYRNNYLITEQNLVARKFLNASISPDSKIVLRATLNGDHVILDTYYMNFKNDDELIAMKFDELHSWAQKVGIDPALKFANDEKDYMINLIKGFQNASFFPSYSYYYRDIKVKDLEKMGMNIDEIHTIAVSNSQHMKNFETVIFAFAMPDKVITYQPQRRCDLEKAKIFYQKPTALLTAIKAIRFTPSNDLEIQFEDGTKNIKELPEPHEVIGDIQNDQKSDVSGLSKFLKKMKLT